MIAPMDGPAMVAGMISLADFRAAQEAHTRVARKQVRAVFLAFGVAGLVLLAAEYYLVGVILFAGALYGEYAVRTLGARQLETAFAQHAVLRSPVEYWWDADGISSRNAMSQSTRPWSSYVRVQEYESAFLLYQTDHLFEMVPKAWFTGAEQLEQFRDFAKPLIS